MDEARLAAGVEASALIRVAQAQGGFGMVLHKGVSERGTLLIMVLERGVSKAMLARQFDGLRYAWTALPGDLADSLTARLFLEKRARNDPDEWQIELDVPSAQRLVAEMTSTG